MKTEMYTNFCVSILKRATVYLVYVFTWFCAVTLSVFESHSVCRTCVCDRVLHRGSHPSPVVSVGPTVCDQRQQGSATHPRSLSASERSELREKGYGLSLLHAGRLSSSLPTIPSLLLLSHPERRIRNALLWCFKWAVCTSRKCAHRRLLY